MRRLNEASLHVYGLKCEGVLVAAPAFHLKSLQIRLPAPRLRAAKLSCTQVSLPRGRSDISPLAESVSRKENCARR
jgi:hypothetical protein